MHVKKNQYADGYEGQIRPPASLLLGADVVDDLAGNYSLSVASNEGVNSFTVNHVQDGLPKCFKHDFKDVWVVLRFLAPVFVEGDHQIPNIISNTKVRQALMLQFPRQVLCSAYISNQETVWVKVILEIIESFVD